MSYEKWKYAAPYGKWTCADGREVLFNRLYWPILQRIPRQPHVHVPTHQALLDPPPQHNQRQARSRRSRTRTDEGCYPSVALPAGGIR
jgi:hypothetical protein